MIIRQKLENRRGAFELECYGLCFLLLVASSLRLPAQADLKLQVSWPVRMWVVGGTNSFVLTLTNQGPDTASGVLLTNQLPRTFALCGVVLGQGTWSNDAATVYCDLGDLTNQQSTIVTVTAVPNAGGTVTNLAGVLSGTADTNVVNNLVQTTDYVRLPYLRASSTSVIEGDEGLTNATFAVWLDSPSPQPVSLNYYTVNQTATAGLDFIATNGVLLFSPGVLTQTFCVPVIGDRLYESDPKIFGESFRIGFSNAVNATFADQLRWVTCTIVDDDPMPSLTVNDISVVEGQSGTTQALFNIALSAPSGMPTTFTFATADETATAGVDYLRTLGSRTLPAGQTNWAVSVAVSGDTEPEPDEVFRLVLSNPVNATLARTQAFCTILTDELVLSVPAVVQENAGLIPKAASISICSPMSADLVVGLNSSQPGLITAPAAVAIPAGATNTCFDLVVQDDLLLNGSRTAVLAASAFRHADTQTAITIHDNETTILTLQLPAVVEEGSGSCTGLVSAAVAPDEDVMVTLSSSNTNRVQPPGTVLLSAGQTSAEFVMQLPNDLQIDGNEIVMLTAHVENWTDGTANMLVLDLTNLTLTIPTPLLEGQWATGAVRVTASAPTNQSITLSASDSSVLAVPASIEIPAGELSASFTCQAVEDSVYRGNQTVSVIAAAPWFRSASNSVTVLENDPHHFTISRVPVSREAYVYYYDLVLTACDQAGAPLGGFNGQATLTATGLDGSVDVGPGATSAFSEGVCTQYYYFHSWDNNVRLAVSDGHGHTAQSNPFNIRRPNHHTLDYYVNDLAWDSVRGWICASIMDAWSSPSNCIAFINPYTGKLESTLYVGPGPGKLAISDDSRYLYIGLTGTNLVRRLDLATGTVDLEFSLGEYVYGGGYFRTPRYVEDMHVMPGSPEVVAVCRMLPGVSPRAAGVALYDHGVQRPAVYGDVPSFGPNVIEFGASPTRLYGYDTQVSTFTFHRMYALSSGVVPGDGVSLMTGYNLDFHSGNGRVYVSNGQVFNPESCALVGGVSGGWHIPAPNLGLVLVLPSPDRLLIYRESDLALLQQEYIPNCGGTVGSGIRWGSAGVAFRVTNNDFALYIIQSDFLTDLDGNGLPDDWERQHFGAAGTPPGGPDADPDHDGMTNYAEYVAGTDPLDPSSALRLDKIDWEGGSVVIEVPSIVGRCYRLERTSKFQSAIWSPVDELPGTGEVLHFRDTASGSDGAFYRLQVFF